VRWAVKDLGRHEPLYCRALAGESDYDICINADLTVSCNCQDFDGQGRIGDLRVESLGDIFHGPRVADFQARLAVHKYPTDICRTCAELAVIPEERLAEAPIAGGLPTLGIMVENTALCNLRCALCSNRDQRLATLGQASLSLDDVTVISRILQEYGIRRICYFNLGEPLLSPRIDEEVQVIRSLNPDIEIITSTNGVLLDAERRMDAVLAMDHVFVSLDGVDQASAGRYQAGTDFERVIANMAELVRRRAEGGRSRGGTLLPVIEWKYVAFSWNDKPEQIVRAIELARRVGVDLISFSVGVSPDPEDRSARLVVDPTLTKFAEKTEDGFVVVLGRASGRESDSISV